MKAFDKVPVRIKASEVLQPVGLWNLPEVGSSHVIGIQSKKNEALIEEVSVVEDEIVAEKVTLAELESIREGAYEEGFSEGKKAGYEFGLKEGQDKGHKEGVDKGNAEVTAKLQSLESLILSLEAPLASQHNLLAELVTQLSIQIAEAVIGHHAAESKDTVLASVRGALEMLPKDSKACTVSVNPADLDAVKGLLEDHADRWQVKPNKEVTAGGCLISAGESLIENTIETRLASVTDEVKKRLADSITSSTQEDE